MENAITALIVISILVLSILGLSDRSMSAQASIADASRQLQERVGDRTRTSLATLDATTISSGNSVKVTLRNAGQTKLADFNQWDVVLQYTDTGGGNQVKWYAYSTQWTNQIYLVASPPTPEVIEPGILNPGEEMVITVNVSPPVGTGTTNLATIATPNGIRATAVFTR